MVDGGKNIIQSYVLFYIRQMIIQYIEWMNQALILHHHMIILVTATSLHTLLIKKGVEMLFIVYTSVCLIGWVDYQNNHTYTSILGFDFF